MSEPRSVLDRAAASAGQTIRIKDRGPVGQVTLRGDLGSEALGAAADHTEVMRVIEGRGER